MSCGDRVCGSGREREGGGGGGSGGGVYCHINYKVLLNNSEQL